MELARWRLSYASQCAWLVPESSSPAASRIPVGCEMIQIFHRCQSLPKITCFKKNDGVTSQTLAVLRYSRWRSRWPTNSTSSFFSGTIDRTDIILVSSIGLSGSENPKKHIQFIPQLSRDLVGIGHAPNLSVIDISRTKSHTNDVAVSKMWILGSPNLNIIFFTVYDLCLTLHAKVTLSEMVGNPYLDR